MKKTLMSIAVSSLLLLSNIQLNAKIVDVHTEIQDLKSLKQDVSGYFNNIPDLNSSDMEKLDNKYNELFFSPWTNKNFTPSIADTKWGFGYKNKEMYGENLKKIPSKWFEEIEALANYDTFKSVSKTGIIVNNSDLRVIPSSKPFFYNPSVAGEGFPFDYNQNSSIKLNTPVFISHYSKDKKWALIESSVAVGWIPVEDIAIVDDNLISEFMNSNYYVSMKDNLRLFNNDIFQAEATIGTILPIKDNNILVVKRDFSGKGIILPMNVEVEDKEFVLKKPVKFEKKNIELIGNQLIGTPYTWGGGLGNRDCSAMTKDFFSPFGIFLPRNSKAQAYSGKYIELEGLSSADKKQKIMKEGKPFQTLLYMNGHIMIYIGSNNGEPLIMHDFWGVKTVNNEGTQGRIIVGKTAITTLEPGKELSTKYKIKGLTGSIKGMTLLN